MLIIYGIHSPETYFILEHFADNAEETALSNNGFMFWGNMSYNYAQASMGYGGDLSWGVHSQRGWNNPHLVTYMESHDEERIMYQNKNFGNSSGSYYIQMSNTALSSNGVVICIFTSNTRPKNDLAIW
ncbi:MAG: hypothetical protein CM15mP107_1760 [Bacteroidota bacterium]|nr:MAG: hypothetical protein CM15mP107_1760 [Bacteroidota bacterium]